MSEEVNPQARLRAFVDRHKTQVEAADALGVSAPFLSDMLTGRRDVSVRVLEQLGLRRTVVSKDVA